MFLFWKGKLPSEEVQLGRRGQSGGFTTQDTYQYTKTFLYQQQIHLGTTSESFTAEKPNHVEELKEFKEVNKSQCTAPPTILRR